MNSVNLQAWLPACIVANIAKYMETSGNESRQLSTIVRVATEVLSGILVKKGIVDFQTDAEAIRYLSGRGFAVATRKDKQKKMIETLQEEAIIEVSSSPEAQSRIQEALEKEGL